METELMERSLISANGTKREKILVEIPQSDMIFFKFFADKLGWQFNSRQRLWEEYIKDSPENADLTDEEIMEEVRAVRYEKVQGHR
jgi:hypothetical protein